jgi:DUF1707 SHOCT-like domain
VVVGVRGLGTSRRKEGACPRRRAQPAAWCDRAKRTCEARLGAASSSGTRADAPRVSSIAMTDSESSVPARRASDAERERAAELLREAMASGRLGVDELDQRTQLVFAATTREELERLVEDVLVPAEDHHPLASGPTSLSAGEARMPVARGSDGTRRIVSIFSGSERKGRWRVGPSCTVVNVFGGSEIDLSEAELAADRVELKVVSVFGGATVILPEHLNVEVSDVGILGGNGVDIGEEHPDPGGPIVRVRLISILAGASVKRRRRTELGQRGEPLQLGPNNDD